MEPRAKAGAVYGGQRLRGRPASEPSGCYRRRTTPRLATATDPRVPIRRSPKPIAASGLPVGGGAVAAFGRLEVPGVGGLGRS